MSALRFGRTRRRFEDAEGGERQHALKFASGSEYFTFSFAFTAPIDIDRVANRLLKSGLAETATRAGDRVRVGKRFVGMARTRRRAADYLAIDDWLNSEEESKPPLTGRQRVRLARVLVTALARSARRNDDGDGDGQSANDSLNEALSLIDGGVEELQVRGGIRSAIDVDQLSPRYWENSPTVRLLLRPFGVRLAIDSPTSDLKRCHVYLLLHESGVCQLTIEVPLDEQMDVDQLLRVSRAQVPFLRDTRVASVVLTVAQRQGEVQGDWTSSIEEGVHWLTTHFAEPIRVEDIFNLYKETIQDLAKESMEGNWLCYTTTFAHSGECCSDKMQWRSMHAVEIAALTTRSPGYALSLSDVAGVAPDLSELEDTLLFVMPGSSLKIGWRGGTQGRSVPDELRTVTAIEMVLLQYWQFITLERRAGAALQKDTKLLAVQRELFLGMDEFERVNLNSRDLLAIADELQRHLRLDGVYARVDRRIELLAQYGASVFARRSTRRASLLSWLALLFAVTFGLPSVTQGLQILRRGGQVDALSGMTDAQLANLAVWIFACALLAIGVTLLVVLMPRRVVWRRRLLQRWRWRQPGVPWKEGAMHVSMRKDWGEQVKLSDRPRPVAPVREDRRFTATLSSALRREARTTARTQT